MNLTNRRYKHFYPQETPAWSSWFCELKKEPDMSAWLFVDIFIGVGVHVFAKEGKRERHLVHRKEVTEPRGVTSLVSKTKSKTGS